MMRINPVYRIELKQTARMKKTMILLLVFNTLLALFGLFSFYFTFERAKQTGQIVNYSDILLIYGIITGIEFILVLFITPGVTSGAIAGEKEKQTLDILLSTTMTPSSIIRGKLLASINLMLMLSFSSLPIIAIVFSIGGITIKEIFEFIILLCITAIYIGSIGIFFSSVCKRSTIATVCTYTTLLVITLGITLLLMRTQFLENISRTDTINRIVAINKTEASNGFLLLLINPIFTFAGMIHDQIGIDFLGIGSWKTQNQIVYYIFQNWFKISIVVQLLISIILNIIAGKVIRPSRHLKKKIQS